MTNALFQKLLASYANRTAKIRAGMFDSSGAYRVPEEVLNKIGCIVSLLDEQIDQFCGEGEYLLIYNFQTLNVLEKDGLYSLDMLIKPMTKISDPQITAGRPVTLVVDGMTGDVMNNAAGMITLGIADEDDLQSEQPHIYGNYNDYKEPRFSDKLKELETAFYMEEQKKELDLKHGGDKPGGDSQQQVFSITLENTAAHQSVTFYYTSPSPAICPMETGLKPLMDSQGSSSSQSTKFDSSALTPPAGTIPEVGSLHPAPTGLVYL
jgi:hypothetical protein